MAKKTEFRQFPPPVRRKSRFNVIRQGIAHSYWGDLYHRLLILSWPQFIGLIVLGYLTVNTLFALLYLAGGNCLANAQPGSFLDAFFFSVQTMASIGYGAIHPITVYANVIVAIEALVGLLILAMGTGMIFARFSLPAARVLFSKVAVVAPYNNIPTLMFRAANQRSNFILDAQIRVTLVRNEVTQEGQFMRRFYELPLVRNESPIFSLTWLVMHPINENSPLYQETSTSLIETEAELVITLTGIDETISQTIHTRHSFLPQEILWNMRFVDIFSRLPDGHRLIDYNKFHEVIPVNFLI
jgi:inward rectifier potassium channel